jgi:hypothetical protein
MGVALSAASSFKNSLFHLSLSSVFTLCCSVFSFLGRPNIHTTHIPLLAEKSSYVIKRKKKKKKKQRKKLKKKKKKQRKSE